MSAPARTLSSAVDASAPGPINESDSSLRTTTLLGFHRLQALLQFVQAIETVNAGDQFFSSGLARATLNQMLQGNRLGPDPADLTAREREVLTHIAEGLCNKEIACLLDIGTRTVETHRERLMHKLNIHSIAGLTRFAVAKGLITVPELALA